MKLLFNFEVIDANKVKARAEAEIGSVNAREILDALQNAATRFYTGD